MNHFITISLQKDFAVSQYLELKRKWGIERLIQIRGCSEQFSIRHNRLYHFAKNRCANRFNGDSMFLCKLESQLRTS